MSTPPPSTTSPPETPVSTADLVAKAEALPTTPATPPTTPVSIPTVSAPPVTPILPPDPKPEVKTEPPKSEAKSSVKICQNDKCKFECADPNYQYCPKCGEPFEALKPICKNKKCGFENPTGAKYCCKCSRPLNDKTTDWRGWWKFIKVSVLFAFYMQIAFVVQMFVMSDYTIIQWNNVWVCIAFSIIPAIGAKLLKDNENDIKENQKEVDETNDTIRSQGYKTKEELAKQRAKQKEFDEAMK